jgi:hypothetical protein
MKYRITIEEWLPTQANSLQRAMRQLPAGFWDERLSLSTDKDLVAAIAKLVEVDTNNE